MRIPTLLVVGLLSLLLGACSGVDIQPAEVDKFTAGQYRYYKWRSQPLPQGTHSSDPIYALDPVMRRQVDADLGEKGYVLDPAQAQFTVDYIFAQGLRQGAEPEQASNISPIPSVTPNRQVDGASVDNAIALGGVKETNNIMLQFNDVQSNEEVWNVIMTKIVENANQVEAAELDKNLDSILERALKPLPVAAAQ